MDYEFRYAFSFWMGIIIGACAVTGIYLLYTLIRDIIKEHKK